MHPEAQEAILNRIIAISDSADTGSVGGNETGRSWEELGFPNTRIDATGVEELARIADTLLSKQKWGDRLSAWYIDDRLSKVLVGGHRGGRGQAAALLEELVREVQSFETEQTVFVPITGLTLMVPELRVGRVTIRKGPPPTVPADSNPGRYLTERTYAEFRTVAEPIRAGERGAQETRHALEAITFAHVASDPFGHASDAVVSLESEATMSAAWVGTVSEHAINFEHRRTQRSWPVVVASGSLAMLNVHALDDLSELLARTPTDRTKFDELLLLAVHWFAASQAQIEVENRLLNLTMCLEALVGPPKGFAPISSTISDAVALIVGDNYEERKEIQSFIKAQYNTRSGVSHEGERGSVAESDVRRFRELVVKLTMRMIALRGVMKDRKDISHWLERTRLSGPLASPGTKRTIREIREERGLSFMELVGRLHCRPEELDLWERSVPDLSALRRLADALDFPMDHIALPAHTRLLNHRGHRFLIAARQQADGRWVARTMGWDPNDADEWPCRSVDPDHPSTDSPSIIVTAKWNYAAESAKGALDGLAQRISRAMDRALIRTRLLDAAEDWQPPETPQHWIDHLGAKRQRDAERSGSG